VDVQQDQAKLDEMLRLSDGQRRVPIILEDGKISIGYAGGS
jgi:glutaredoxin